VQWSRLGVVIVWVALGGCSATIPAPIHDDSASFFSGPQRFYRALPGDTLYSIAFETGHDYRQLAQWNAIRSPYRITVGEEIRLAPPQYSASPAPAQAPEIPRRLAAHSRPLVTNGRIASRKLPVSRPPTTPIVSVSHRLRRVRSWIWPARGRVEDTFGGRPADGQPGNKGIMIVGTYGEPVRAAAAGRVVYAGSGLPGYGELIIVKHNNDYLSAYAHNARIDTKEGAMVRQGQIIATMGDSGTDRVGLDFEIRKRGIAVNPIHYLPHIHHQNRGGPTHG